MRNDPMRPSLALSLVMAGFAFAADGPPDAHQSHETIAPAPHISGESLYQLDVPLTTADGRTRALAQLRGRPVLITMFYASCDGVCPLLAFNLQRMERGLPPDERQRLQVLMVSFDPGRDSPEALARFAAMHRIDDERWWLARAPEARVRELAAVLGVRYREASPGIFAHSALVTLLDAEGIVVASTSRLDQVDPAFHQALRRTLAAL
jgi:protein SCO1